jgi:autotransporter-associated beta strand protein
VTNSAASGTSTLTVSSGTFNGVINDGATAAVALTKTSTGTLNLSGNSNYSGVTAINAGTITISQANALGSTTGNTTIAYNGSSNASGGLLRLSNGITTAENITITGAEGGSYLGAIGSSSGTSTFSGTITLTASSPGASIRLGGDGTTIFSGNITQTGTAANLALYKTNTVNNPIAINGNALIVIGGTSILKGVSGSGIGTTIISQTGVLQLGVTDALNTANDLEIGWYGTETGTLNLASYNQTIRGLTSASTGATRSVINSVVSTNSTLTVGNGGGTYTFSGTILNNTGTGGTVALVKTGAGTQTLSGVNTYTGGTRIDNGTLTLGHATNTLANTGAVNVNGGTLALGTNSDTVGAVTLTSGFITSSTGVLTGTSYAVESGTVSGILGGSGALSKSTTGTVTISNTQTYSGATTVSAGTLYVTGTLSNSAVTVQADGTIGRNGATTGGLGNGLTIQAGGKLDLTGATLGADSAAILGITSGNLTLGNLAFTDLIGWDYTNAALGTYELIDGGFTVDFGSTAYTNPMNAFSFGNGKFGYFTSGSLNAVIIPEPSVALLGGLGLLALLRRRR